MTKITCKHCAQTFALVGCDGCGDVLCEKDYYGPKHECDLTQSDLRAKVVELLSRPVTVPLSQALTVTLPQSEYRLQPSFQTTHPPNFGDTTIQCRSQFGDSGTSGHRIGRPDRYGMSWPEQLVNNYTEAIRSQAVHS